MEQVEVSSLTDEEREKLGAEILANPTEEERIAEILANLTEEERKERLGRWQVYCAQFDDHDAYCNTLTDFVRKWNGLRSTKSDMMISEEVEISSAQM